MMPPYEGGPLHNPGPGRLGPYPFEFAPLPALIKKGTRYYLDCEFVDDGKTIGLISIGIVCEDGRELYLQSVEFDTWKASDWVRANVYPHLSRCAYIRFGDGLPVLDLVEQVNLDKGLHGQGRKTGPDERVSCLWRTRAQIRDEIQAFLDPARHGKPELYGWCSGYDWVAFCQLWGTMMQIPEGYPHYINDLQQELDQQGISDEELPPQSGTAHNALDDARHIRHLWGVVCGHYAAKDPPILPPYIG